MKMDFYSKLFCFTTCTIMLVVVVIMEKSRVAVVDHQNVPPPPPSMMMIGFQPKPSRIDHHGNFNDDNHNHNHNHFRAAAATTTNRIDDEDYSQGSGYDNSRSDEYDDADADPNEFGSKGTPNFLRNREQAELIMFDLDRRCRSLIMEDEEQCFRNYFVRYGNMDEVVFTNDPKSDFNRKACCSFWQWYDCTRVSLKRECDDYALRLFETKLKRSYVYTTYCVNYEYGSDACGPFTIWMIIGFATLAIMVLVGTCLAVGLVIRYLHTKHEQRARTAGQNYDVPEEFEL